MVGSLPLSPPHELRFVLTFPHRTERENVDGQAEAEIAHCGEDRRVEKIGRAQER
jgi:hypothetical protein